MASGRRRLKRPYALFIIALTILGGISGAFVYLRSLSQNQCGGSTPPSAFSKIYFPVINYVAYNAVNATYSNDDKALVFSKATFIPVSFSAKLLLVGGNCVIDGSVPVSLSLQVTFSDGSSEPLNIQYLGSTSQQAPVFTSHSAPRAGVAWYPKDPWVVLLVSQS